MTILDLSIIILFFAGFIIYGLFQGKNNQSANDYFVGKKSLPWWVAMFSIVATETSVLTFVSVPGKAFQGEWFFLQLAFGFILGRILVCIFLLPDYFRNEVTSIYQVLGSRFGTGIQKSASLIFLVTRVLADGIRFLATAVIVQVITGWSLPVSVLLIGVVTSIYTFSGGIRTIVWIDSIQFILYLAGGLISIVYMLIHFHDPIIDVFTNLMAAGKFQIFQFGWDLEKPYLFFNAVFGGMLLSFASHGADHMMVQRVLSTKSLSSARKAMIGSGVFVCFQFLVFLLVGSLLHVFFQNIDISQIDLDFINNGQTDLKQDRVFPLFIVQFLPVGLKGLLLAGVLSAAMSTLSSSINSLASSTVTDWFRKNQSLKNARVISLLWAIILMGIALIFDESDKAIIDIGLEIASFTYGGLLGLFILSKFKRNFHPASVTLGLISSILIVFLLKEIGLAWTWFIFVAVTMNLVITNIFESLFYLRSDE